MKKRRVNKQPSFFMSVVSGFFLTFLVYGLISFTGITGNVVGVSKNNYMALLIGLIGMIFVFAYNYLRYLSLFGFSSS